MIFRPAGQLLVPFLQPQFRRGRAASGGGGGAAPQVAGSNSSQNDTASTSHSVSLPATIVSGNLLLVIMNCANTSITTPSGWTLEHSRSGVNGAAAVLSRIADGSEGSTLSVTTGSGRSSHLSYRITGH